MKIATSMRHGQSLSWHTFAKSMFLCLYFFFKNMSSTFMDVMLFSVWGEVDVGWDQVPVEYLLPATE